MIFGVPASLRLTVPLILLGFAAVLSAVNVWYHVPRAERAAEEDVRERLAQEMSRLQSTLEYLMLKGDLVVAQHEIAVLAHNHDYRLVVLADDQHRVVAATRRAWLDRPIEEVLPKFDPEQAARAIRDRRASVTIDTADHVLLGYAGILMGGQSQELRPTRTGSLFLMHDLNRAMTEARARVLEQSLYWAGWVTALALAMWLAFHFLLTRRTARLVQAAEQIAAGNLGARSALRGSDELGRLSRAFDAMAIEVAQTQTRLRQDIAERVLVQRALEDSEASYHAIFDAVEDAIFVLDVERARIVDLNPKACTTYGYTREEMQQLDMMTLSSGASSHTAEDARAIVVRAMAGEPLRFEWHRRNKDGSLHWDEVFVKRVVIGGHHRILALAREITDRKNAEEKLRASEEQYRSMFNASIDGLALWNAQGVMVDTNPALWRMYGYHDPYLAASPAQRHAGPSYYPALLRTVTSGESLHVEVTEQRQDGTPLTLEVHGVPMQYQGKPHVLTIARDITEKKHSERELTRQREALHQREKLAALGSLLAGVAHELNNPLAVVVARAVMLEEQGEPATRAAAMKLRTAADRCARIVRTFLAMARQEQPRHGPVLIKDVVTAALDIASYAVRRSNIEVVLDLAKDIPPILADADQLHQVLLNLIINAQQSLQDAPAPRRIRISARTDAGQDAILVTVADNGPGIAEHLRARIFEPYFTTKPQGAGTGVGLAVSFGIIEAHGGLLTLDCPEAGGAVFTIRLPIGLPAPAAVTEVAAVEPDIRHGTVLVVDDEPEIRETLTEILTLASHRVVTAASAREALARLTAESFDVILTDMRMPDLDGRGLVDEIERRWPERAASVVFVTGDTLVSSLREFADRNGYPVIEKPFLPADVRAVVAAVIASRRGGPG